MNEANWRTFLADWNRDLSGALARSNPTDLAVADVTANELSAGWLGYAGASEQTLVALEKKLGTALPPSYRAFLAVSDGFRQPGCFVPRIFPTGEIVWLKDSQPDSIKAWIDGENFGGPPLPVPDERYFVYDQNQRTDSLRSEYLWKSLQISAQEQAGTAVYLLNSAVIFPDGEWEAWFWAHWLPGARRYRSFWDMMQEERQSFLELLETEQADKG